LLKAADGAVLERRRFTKNHAARPAMAATPTTPPTTPPAIAPTFELLEVEVGDCVVIEDPVTVTTGVKEADAPVVVSMTEPVD